MGEIETSPKMMTSESSERISLKKARVYGQKFENRPGKKKVGQLETIFAKHMHDLVGKDATIVDVPCGNGRFYTTFSKAKKLYCVDVSENMLKAFDEKFNPPNHVKMIKANAEKIPISDGVADLCFCMRLFHHLKTDRDRLGVLKELRRISKEYVALSFYNKNSLRYWGRKILLRHIRGNYCTYGHFMKLAGEVGLQLVERSPSINWFEPQCLVLFRKI